MLEMNKLDRVFGLDARSRTAETAQRGLEGAVAALESFYFGFNHRDMATMQTVWDNSNAIQLNNPLGGIVRGTEDVMAVYDRIFNGKAIVWVALSDIMYYASDELVVFTGTETGAFTTDGKMLPLSIRTSRLFGYRADLPRWVQLHHHGSIADADLLKQYQLSVVK